MFWNNRLHLSLLPALAALCLLAGCSSQPHARTEPITSYENHEEGSFDMASAATDSTLSGMRGGFFTAGGLQFDFGIISSTSIGGMQVNSLSLSTSSVNDLLPSGMKQFVKAGSANQMVTVPSTATNPSYFTAVQNTLNNQTIQNTNQLNLTVSNLAAFRTQQMMFNQRFASGLSR